MTFKQFASAIRSDVQAEVERHVVKDPKKVEAIVDSTLAEVKDNWYWLASRRIADRRRYTRDVARCLSAAGRSDRDAFAEFYARACPHVQRVVRCILRGCPADIDDVVASVMDKLWRAWPILGNPLAYARTAATNASIDHLRTLERRPTMHPDPETALTAIADSRCWTAFGLARWQRDPHADEPEAVARTLAAMQPDDAAAAALRHELIEFIKYRVRLLLERADRRAESNPGFPRMKVLQTFLAAMRELDGGVPSQKDVAIAVDRSSPMVGRYIDWLIELLCEEDDPDPTRPPGGHRPPAADALTAAGAQGGPATERVGLVAPFDLLACVARMSCARIIRAWRSYLEPNDDADEIPAQLMDRWVRRDGDGAQVLDHIDSLDRRISGFFTLIAELEDPLRGALRRFLVRPGRDRVAHFDQRLYTQALSTRQPKRSDHGQIKEVSARLASRPASTFTPDFEESMTNRSTSDSSFTIWLTTEHFIRVDRQGYILGTCYEGALGCVILVHSRAGDDPLALKIPRMLANTVRENALIAQLVDSELRVVGSAAILCNGRVVAGVGELCNGDNADARRQDGCTLLFQFSRDRKPRVISVRRGADRKWQIAPPGCSDELELLSEVVWPLMVGADPFFIESPPEGGPMSLAALSNTTVRDNRSTNWFGALPAILYSWADRTPQEVLIQSRASRVDGPARDPADHWRPDRIIHHDLSPENIMIHRPAAPKCSVLGDFDLRAAASVVRPDVDDLSANLHAWVFGRARMAPLTENSVESVDITRSPAVELFEWRAVMRAMIYWEALAVLTSPRSCMKDAFLWSFGRSHVRPLPDDRVDCEHSNRAPRDHHPRFDRAESLRPRRVPRRERTIGTRTGRARCAFLARTRIGPEWRVLAKAPWFGLSGRSPSPPSVRDEAKSGWAEFPGGEVWS